MRGACVALLVAALWAAAPAGASELVYDPDGSITTRQDSCKRADGAFMVDMVKWADVVRQAITAYNLEDFTAAKHYIVEAERVYWRAEDPCSSYAKDVERKCGWATNYYKVGLRAAAKADVDKALRFMRLGHKWVQEATKAVIRLRAYYRQL
jgi:hypothetical protein